jgi:hypothetical protein
MFYPTTVSLSICVQDTEGTAEEPTEKPKHGTNTTMRTRDGQLKIRGYIEGYKETCTRRRKITFCIT